MCCSIVFENMNPGLPTISQAVAHQLTELPKRSNLPDKKKSQCPWSLIVCKKKWVSDSKQNNFEDSMSSQIGKDTIQDSSTLWPMKIWWSMPNDAWPWFLNPHGNLRRNIIDWWVFLSINFYYPVRSRSQIFSRDYCFGMPEAKNSVVYICSWSSDQSF